MLTEQYTADAICRAVGLPAFVDQALSLPALRLVMMPSFDPEVCVTINRLPDGARLSVVALAESFWQQPAPCRLPAWKASATVTASEFDERIADFTDAVATDREATGRMVCMDGMSVHGCLITEAGVERIVCRSLSVRRIEVRLTNHTVGMGVVFRSRGSKRLGSVRAVRRRILPASGATTIHVEVTRASPWCLRRSSRLVATTRGAR